MRSFHSIIALLAVSSWSSRAVTVSSRVDVIELPVGYFPEGIALAEEWTVYVGSLNDGSIWEGSLETGNGSVVILGSGNSAAGMDYDRRSGYLYVSGGPSGNLSVYDTRENYTMVNEFDLESGNITFINDVIVGKDAVFVTDSFQPNLYTIKLDKDTGCIEGNNSITIPLGPNFTFVEGAFNANGIELSQAREKLIIVNMASGELFTVDPSTGNTSVIDLGPELVHGDGLIVRKDTLWVVENTAGGGNATQISEVVLSHDLTSARVVRRLQNDLFDFPTTAVRKGNSIYTVVSKLGLSFVTPELIPNTTYQIVRVDRDEAEFA